MTELSAPSRRRTRAGALAWLCPPRCVLRARGLTACALALLIAGCAITPVDELARPAFEMPERFARDGDIPMRADWWQTFDDPALDRLVDRALSNNFTLRSAYARVEQARATLAAEGAALFPSVDASAEQSATRRSSGDSVSTSVAGDDFDLVQDRSNWSDTRSLQFSASYELDLWGRLRNSREAAAFDTRAADAALQAAAISVAGDLASSWYQYQELRERIALLESQIETNQNVLDLTTFAFKQGQAEAADVLRQRQAVESVRGQLEQARASAKVVRHALAVLVGVAPGEFEPPDGRDLVELPALPDTGVPADLLMRRPDVREQFYTVAAADRRVAVAVAERYPQLSLSASLSTSTDGASLFSNWVTQLAASLTQPVFDGGALAAEVDRSEAVLEETLAGYQQSLLEALAEVEDALTNEYRQRRYIEHLDEQLRLSAETVDNLRLRYLRGAADYLDVLDALLTRQDLQVEYLSARRQLLDYRINLYRALAGGVGEASIAGRDTEPLAVPAADNEPQP
ncbi:efflux transporter outer membrane subunit [Salinisphaera orenii]|uniref:efflux transporter outer membrane subunit n=1 Tax=Salinisphaera orenii TaxID=856731 RepID=UPI000F4A2015|nr:TolC family protein [Salinisphaera halophila]